MIVRQRATPADDFLLHVVFPWLNAMHAKPLLRLARFWNAELRPQSPVATGIMSPQRR